MLNICNVLSKSRTAYILLENQKKKPTKYKQKTKKQIMSRWEYNINVCELAVF
jgi:hypothetical protein